MIRQICQVTITLSVGRENEISAYSFPAVFIICTTLTIQCGSVDQKIYCGINIYNY